ncbi:GTP-binding protein [Bacillus sp. C11]|nr:GTP-binding protein [Neobacillus terrae]
MICVFGIRAIRHPYIYIEGKVTTLENQLIQKAYYESFMGENEKRHPVQVLGEVCQEEQTKELPELANIRFAQGEVYFLNKDFESAIFKWENIGNDLEPWAKKNIGDAYYELGQLSVAEDFYKSVETDNEVLQTEVALQLFSLYIDRGKQESAVSIIKGTVSANPDYPNVTEIARAYFEREEDWNNAIELAVLEAIRTQSLDWFDVLNSYVEGGYARNHSPEYFLQALLVLFDIDQKRFERLAVSLWENYKNQDNYFTWLKEINQLLVTLDMDREGNWHSLSAEFQEAYFALIDGRFLIKKIQDLVPVLLENWLRITDVSHALFASAAVLSWSEIFPSSISAASGADAEKLLNFTGAKVNWIEEGLHLFETIQNWAKGHQMDIGNRMRWIIGELTNFHTNRLLLAGMKGSGKSAFINSVLSENILGEEPTSAVVMFRDHAQVEIDEIGDTETRMISDLADFRESTEKRRGANSTIVDFKLPSQFLMENRVALIDTPGFNGELERSETVKYLHLADTILFFLDANSPLTDRERTVLAYIQELAPEIPVHFLLNKMDIVENEEAARAIAEDTWEKINHYFPNSKIFAFSKEYDSGKQLKDLSEFIKGSVGAAISDEGRTSRLLFFVRQTIRNLVQDRIAMENDLVESVKWNNDMSVKLNGALNQLDDIEVEKKRNITKSYKSLKDEIKSDISKTVPGLLKNTSELITEQSDLSKIHIELNDEMNRRIREYLEENVMPKYYQALQEWIQQSNNEFTETQIYLDEMSEGFNALYGEERIKLQCDFRVVDDWRRDSDRMTNGVQFEKENILLRNTPGQFLLKSAGRLFGVNNSMVYNKYKSFVENEDYRETTDSVIKKFLQQFELFEKSLERDIELFFRDPIQVLNSAVTETKAEIETDQEKLDRMRTNPEMYRDPLALFEVRVRQYEWMSVAGRENYIH